MSQVRFKKRGFSMDVSSLDMLLPMLLAAAASDCQTPTQSSRVEQPSRQAREPGYAAERRFAVTTRRETWTLCDDALDVTLVHLSGQGPFLVIEYLPGLGESSSGGPAWRQAWDTTAANAQGLQDNASTPSKDDASGDSAGRRPSLAR